MVPVREKGLLDHGEQDRLTVERSLERLITCPLDKESCKRTSLSTCYGHVIMP